MAEVPGFSALPRWRRLRALALARLQGALDRRGGSGTRHAAPDVLRHLFAPLRAAPPNPAAEVPLDATFPPLADGVRHGPSVSIVMPVYGAEAETLRCLRSLLAFTKPPFDLVVVDDASPGGPASAVREMLDALPAAQLLENQENLGFSRSVNRALRHAQGEVVVMLNSDVVLTPGWLPGLLAALADDGVGLAGPVTNDSGDVATIPASYASVAELVAFAGTRAGRPTRRVRKLSLMCAALPRTALDSVGGLDEGFGRGMFEDDDLCMALSRLGLSTVLVESVYVHHSAGSSFRKLHPREYFAQYEVNRHRFEKKWRVRWRSR